MKRGSKKLAVLGAFDQGSEPNDIAVDVGCSRSYVHAVLKKERKDYKVTLARRRLAEAEAQLGGSE